MYHTATAPAGPIHEPPEFGCIWVIRGHTEAAGTSAYCRRRSQSPRWRVPIGYLIIFGVNLRRFGGSFLISSPNRSIAP